MKSLVLAVVTFFAAAIGQATAADLCDALSVVNHFTAFANSDPIPTSLGQSIRRIANENGASNEVMRLASELDALAAQGPAAPRARLRAAMHPFRMAHPECKLNQPSGSGLPRFKDGITLMDASAGGGSGAPGDHSSGSGNSASGLLNNPASIAVGVAAFSIPILAVGLFGALREREDRVLCNIPVKLVTLLDSGSGRIINVSPGGAKIATDDITLEKGERVDISGHRLDVTGRVRWGNSHYVGISFMKRMEPQDIRAAVAASKTQKNWTS